VDPGPVGGTSWNCCPDGVSENPAALLTIFEICPLVELALGRK
jgi:hypothetical protein